MHETLDRWFNSKCWNEVVSDADKGCPDSVELMEEVSSQLCSLTWHLKNNSDQDRVDYELNFFSQLCDDFEVAEE